MRELSERLKGFIFARMVPSKVGLHHFSRYLAVFYSFLAIESFTCTTGLQPPMLCCSKNTIYLRKRDLYTLDTLILASKKFHTFMFIR